MNARTRQGHRRRHSRAGLRTLVLLALIAVAMTGGGVGGGEGLLLTAAPDRTTGTITIGTIPAVANFPITLDAVTELTDEDGNATFEGNADGLADRITMTDATLAIDGREVRGQAVRLYQFGGIPRLEIDMSYFVTFRFSGQGGSPIDDSSVRTIVVKSETGEVAELPAHEGSWLLGARAAVGQESLTVKDIGWRVQEVKYNGSNVVNTSQQLFVPAQQPDVEVQLLFYRLDIHADDAVFGFASGSAVDLVYPDGTSRRYSLDDNGRLSIPALPRGDYTLTTSGSGPQMSRPLAISRDQVVDVAVYSWLDLATILVGALALSVGLAFWGRSRRRRNRDDVAPDATSDSARHRAGGRHDESPGDEDERADARSRESLDPEVVPPRGAS